MRDTYLALKKEESMTDYLPEVYQHFERRFPAIKDAFDALGSAEHEAGHVSTTARVRPSLVPGTGSEEPQSRHLRSFSRAICAAGSFCWYASLALLASALASLPRHADASY